MKSILLCLAFLLTAPAYAKWTPIFKAGPNIFYVDIETIKFSSNDGNLRSVWMLRDTKQQENNSVLSERTHLEINCITKHRRILALSSYAGSMASGKVIFNGGADPSGWHSIKPRTATEYILEIVCTQPR